MSNITLIVATHKEAPMPQGKIYLPLWVGSQISKADLQYTRDDSGDNISGKNPMYCELTGLYWAWKNLNSDYIGLVHYRRLFMGASKEAITDSEIETILKGYKLIVPKKRRYYIESLESHYIHTHADEEMNALRKVVADKYPNYLASYDKAIKRTWGYMFNMFVLPKDLLDEYCTWMFDIVDEVVSQVGTGSRSDFEKRYPGRLSELLLNCWLEYKLSSNELKKEDIAEVPLLNLGDEKMFKKGVAFLKAKFFGKKQEGSF